MIYVETDSCPTMRGVRNGVIKMLKESMEYIQDLGGCPDHHIANALKYAMLSFDEELKTLFVDVYQDIEKYPTHQERYQQACKNVGIQVKPMFRMVDTRWTIIESCAGRIYEQFDALEHMYTKINLSSKERKEGESNRIFRLVSQFTSVTTPLLKLKLLFLQLVTSKFNYVIKILEKAKPLIHIQHELLGMLIYDHMAAFVKLAVMQKTASYKDLCNVDYQNTDNHLSNRRVLLPAKVKSYMEEMSINDKGYIPVFEEFMGCVLKFNLKATEKLLHYCDIQLTSKTVISLSALNPDKRSDETCEVKILYLQTKFAQVVSFAQRDQLSQEVRDYQGATDIPVAWYKQPCDSGIELFLDISTYWAKVGNMRTMRVVNGDLVSVQRFPLLFKLAAALLSIHHSAAEVEREFSIEKEILTLKRNKMNQQTFNSHMVIHGIVKGLGGCDKVKSSINQDMRKAYRNASARRKEHLAKLQIDCAKEKEVLNFTRKRKVKETLTLHKDKLRELSNQLTKKKQASAGHGEKRKTSSTGDGISVTEKRSKNI